LLRVLAEVVDHFDAFGRKLVDVGVQRVVVEEFADCAFAALSSGDHIVDSFGGRVEARDRGASVVVDLFVTNQFAKCAMTGVDVCNHKVDLVHRLIETISGAVDAIVELVVSQQLSGSAAAGAKIVGNGFKRNSNLIRIVIKRGIVDQS